MSSRPSPMAPSSATPATFLSLLWTRPANLSLSIFNIPETDLTGKIGFFISHPTAKSVVLGAQL